MCIRRQKIEHKKINIKSPTNWYRQILCNLTCGSTVNSANQRTQHINRNRRPRPIPIDNEIDWSRCSLICAHRSQNSNIFHRQICMPSNWQQNDNSFYSVALNFDGKMFEMIEWPIVWILTIKNILNVEFAIHALMINQFSGRTSILVNFNVKSFSPLQLRWPKSKMFITSIFVSSI